MSLFHRTLPSHLTSPPVPSIATEYVRNRKQHDAKARQWTEMYAKPKSAPLVVPTPQPLPASPARGSRSRRAPPPRAGSSSMAGPSRVTSGVSAPIVIDDSDDDSMAVARSTKRKRETATASSTSRSRRTMVPAGDVLEIPDDDGSSLTRPKRARTARNTAPVSDDVIVIED